MARQRRHRFTAIDLFCGCGGLSLGLRKAGFKVLAAVDNDLSSVNSYRMNHRRTLAINDDIQSVDPVEIMEKLNLEAGELDLLAGCPPCQGFSTLRTFNGSYEIDEPMNDLVFEFARFARILLPKTLMMENVPGLMDDDRIRRLQRRLRTLRYKCNVRVLDAAEFGVAQRRQRMILLGSRFRPPVFSSPIRRKRTVAEALRVLPTPETSQDPIHNYSVRRAEHVLSLIRRIPKDGGSRTDLPDEDQLECHRGFDGFKDIYGRMAWRKPSPTITGGCINPSKGRFIHPEEDRAITLREAAVLQGFPKGYMFDLARGRYSVAQMIGNAFPPKFAEHHARSLYQQLEASFGDSN